MFKRTRMGLALIASFVAHTQTVARTQAVQPSNGILEITAIALPTPDRPPFSEVHEVYSNWGGLAEIKIRNISKKVVRLEEVTPTSEFDVDVEDANGVPVARTELGKRVADPNRTFTGIGSASLLQLVPLQEATIRLDLSKVFEVKPHHSYKVTIRRFRGLPKSDDAGKPLQRIELSCAFEVPEFGILR